jgi:hypothetical protein
MSAPPINVTSRNAADGAASVVNGVPHAAAGSKKSFMQAVMAKGAKYESESEDSSTQYTEQSNPLSRPQANSLAMALGMKVDPNMSAPSIKVTSRNVSSSGTFLHSKKSFMQAVMAKAANYDSEFEDSDVPESDSSGTEVADNLSQSLYAPNVLPQPKSLADALNMCVDPISTAPMIRSGKIDPSIVTKMLKSKNCNLTGTVFQRSGLDDLSVSEVTDLDYEDVYVSVAVFPQQAPEPSCAEVVNNEDGKKSFLATIMERVAMSSDTETSEVSSQSTASQSMHRLSQAISPAVVSQPKSLAVALNMSVNSVCLKAPIQEMRSPLPPPAEPEDVDNSESQYDTDFMKGQPGVPFSLTSQMSAFESSGHNQNNNKEVVPNQVLQSLTSDLVYVRSKMKSLIDDFASTNQDVEHLKKGASEFEFKLQDMKSHQAEVCELISKEEARAETAEEAFKVALLESKDQITAIDKSVAASKSEYDSRFSQQELCTTKLSEALEEARKGVVKDMGHIFSCQSELVTGLDELKEQITSLSNKFEANKMAQEATALELVTAEAAERNAGLSEQGKKIEKQLANLSEQYSEGLKELVDKVFESSQWIDAEGKFARALIEIQESRAILSKEHEEVKALKKAMDDHFAKQQDCDDSATSFISDFSEKGEGHTSEVLKSIQIRMRQERLRQKALRKQLKSRMLHIESPVQPQSNTAKGNEFPLQATEELPFDETSKIPPVQSKEAVRKSVAGTEMASIQEVDDIKENAAKNLSGIVTEEPSPVAQEANVVDDQSEKFSVLSTEASPEPLDKGIPPDVGEMLAYEHAPYDTLGKTLNISSSSQEGGTVDLKAIDAGAMEVVTEKVAYENKEAPMDNSDLKMAIGAEMLLAQAEENLNGSFAVTEETADITGDHSKRVSEEGDHKYEDHDKLSTIEDVKAASATEETSNESIRTKDEVLLEHEEKSASLQTAQKTPVAQVKASQAFPPPGTPCSLEGAVGVESQPLPEALQVQMEMNLLRDQVQDIVSIMAELRQEIVARKGKEKRTNDAHIKTSDQGIFAQKSEFLTEYSKMLLTFLGFILLSSSVVYHLTSNEVQILQRESIQETEPLLHFHSTALEHEMVEDLEETAAAAQTLHSSLDVVTIEESRDGSIEAIPAVDGMMQRVEDDVDSVSTAPADQTMTGYFGDEASLSRLDSPVNMKELGADNVIDSDDSFAGAGEMEEEEEVVDIDALKDVDGMDILVPSSALLPKNVEELEAPTLTDFDSSPSMLPPSLAVIHRFTRPVKNKLGSTLSKSARRKMLEKVRVAVEKELASDQWV